MRTLPVHSPSDIGVPDQGPAHRLWRGAAFLARALAITLAVLPTQSGWADEPLADLPLRSSEPGHVTLIEENDALQPRPTDRHYTQGARLSYTSAPLMNGTALDIFFGLTNGLWMQGTPTDRRFELTFGQSIYTPRHYRDTVPDPLDRPFAGWLYGGFGIFQETDRRSLASFELLVGVVGPSALAGPTQAAVHAALGQPGPKWPNELKDEPGTVLSYDRKWRLQYTLDGQYAFEIIPEFGASVGNVFTYAQAGALVRFGKDLEVDYGPARIRPSLSGTTWLRPGSGFGWYIFAGAQTRLVARNIFLDGNTFQDGPSVEKRPVVTDVSAGLSLFLADRLKLDLVVTERTEEFTTQQGRDRFGNINLTVRFP
jgi:lipid A 3-O-deacylase